MTTWAIILLISIPVFNFIFLSIIGRRVDRFRENLSLEEECIIFIEEDRIIGKIVKINRDVITVKVGMVLYLRTRNEIYPI